MPASVEQTLRPEPQIIDLPQADGPTRPAPRLPATLGILADPASRRLSLRSRLGCQARRLLAAMNPWYDWGYANICSVRDDISGDGWYFNIDWLGLHLGIMGGRTPKKAVRS